MRRRTMSVKHALGEFDVGERGADFHHWIETVTMHADIADSQSATIALRSQSKSFVQPPQTMLLDPLT
ncbi:hypothetical protein [Pseudorhodoplanes sinuspersici]|uniref:Uncharacterized protein n=1 Tax=Pseudorhodoplanes sinuspersici TaxID=1235591 RepID=A0A1W6ZN12_9HYPH|nr:hypothetical protein [Pseudorhodoplanes sinuspersici]ARP98520.1 hypothetical protein CAK95_05030 [Pseudorhodoplanes sinuspersici]RKE65889.1 hypothetical protein DFP91_5752 [Pseudorhodoplanes sinuspersici]